MARKRFKPEEIVSKLRQADVIHSQGMSMVDAIGQLGVSEVTFYRWRKEYGGMNHDQLRRLKHLEKENERLRRAVSNLTLDKQILAEAAKGPEGQSAHTYPLKGAVTVMIALCAIADRPAEEIAHLETLRDRVDPSIIAIRRNPRTGGVTRIYSEERMGPNHKRMLQQFAGEAGAGKLNAYFELPRRLLNPLNAKIQRRQPLNPVEIVDYVSALTILILQVCPIRRANLVGSLRIADNDPTVGIPGNSREPVRFRIPAAETKTRKREILAELPSEVGAVLREYVRHVRPQLMQNVGSVPDNCHLFPAAGLEP